jgi:16S rRNA G966 N2-methylase RsmD
MTTSIPTFDNIKKIINKKNALKDLSDSEFEILLPNLANELENYGILYETYTVEEILKDWKLLREKKIVKTVTNVSATAVAGMKIMRKYMRHFHEVANYKGLSVKSLWKKENLEKALRFNRAQHSTPYASEIIRSLSFTNGLGKVTMYRPLMARNVVAYFDAKSVLDVCAGWGGRMIGSKSVNLVDVTYTGMDPCLKTYNALCGIRDELGLTGVTLINKPAELALLELPEETKFDIALTSPPYFNLEIYSNETTQSTNLGDYQAWVTRFLRPVIMGVIKRVTYSCWSVKNIKTDKKYNLLDDVIAIHEENGWKQMDVVFTMSNSRRPGNSSGAETSSPKKTEEVTYVFVKK